MKTKIFLWILIIAYLTWLSYWLYKLELVILAWQVFWILIATLMGALAWLWLIEKDEAKKRQTQILDEYLDDDWEEIIFPNWK